MDRGATSRLNRHRMRLINELNLEKDSVLDQLVNAKILDQSTSQRIRSQPGTHGSARALLDVLIASGPAACLSFQEALSDDYPWLTGILASTEEGHIFRDIPRTPADTKRHPAERLNNRRDFVGRDKQIKQIQTLFKDVEHVGVVGAAGVGKSQLALEYAYRERLSYKLVRWIDADKETIVASIVDFAIDVGIDTKCESISDIIQQLHNHLRRLESYLLVFDNANHNDLAKFLPHASVHRSKQHVIVTGHKLKDLSCVQVEAFSEDESSNFLQTQINKQNAEGNEGRLSEALGFSPLALNLATSHMKKHDCDVDEYLELFEQNLVGLVGVEFGLEGTEQVILKIWIAMLKKLKQEDSNAVLMLLWCAVMFPDNIPIDLFTRSAVFGGRREVHASIKLLRDYSLVCPSAQPGFIYVHRLLLKIINSTIYSSKRIPHLLNFNFLTDVLQPLLSSLTDICPKNISKTIDAKTARYTLPHIRAFDNILDDPKLYSVSASINQFKIYELHEDLLSLNEDVLNLFDDMENCEAIFRKLLEIRKGRHGILHIRVGYAHAQLGNFLRKNKEHAQAREELERAVAIQSKHLGYENDDLGSTLLKLGMVLLELREYFEAKRILEQSLKIKKHMYGENSAEHAEPLSYLAAVFVKQAKLQEAEDMFRRVISARVASLGGKHVECAKSMNDLGSVQRQLGKEDEAKTNFNKSITILENEHGRNHISLAPVLNNLGLVLKEQGDLKEAKVCYERSLRIQEQINGDDHINCAEIHHNIGNLLREQREFGDADIHFKTALSICNRVHGHDNQYADMLTSMAGNLTDLIDDISAKQIYDRALSIYESANGRNHVSCFDALIGLAKLYGGQQDFINAEMYYKRALKAHEEAYGKNRIVYANTLSNLGFVKRNKGDIDGAKDCHLESLKIRDAVFGKNHISSGVPLNNLALVVRELGDYVGAKALFENALFIYSENRYPSNHPVVATIINNLNDTDDLISVRGTTTYRLKSTTGKPMQ